MNRINMIKTVAVLMMVTLALTLTTTASGWQQFRTDEANAGIAADSAPVAAPDDMTICDVQPALQGAAVSDEGTEPGDDAGYLHGLANRTRYDFDTKRATETPKKACAFRWQVGNSPGPGDPSEEFNSDQYSRIKADDGTSHNDTSNSGYYAAHRFNISIDDNEANFITKINVTWNGRGYRGSSSAGGDDGATLYIWKDGTGYEQLDITNLGTEVNLTGERTSSISSYITAGNVTVLVEQNAATSGFLTSYIATDYVKLVVTP
jgi:hypothetical protein